MFPVSRSTASGLRVDPRNATVSSAFRKLPPPVIVIGMHRSGTSLISGMLSLMGVYMDPAMSIMAADSVACPPADALRCLGYGEADAFRRVNDGLLRCSGSDWRNVDGFMADRDRPAFRKWCLLQMQCATVNGLSRDYLANAPGRLVAWGWKDPRTSLTLPYWLQLFPGARVIHVRRNAHSVVDSLICRHEAFGPPLHEAAPSRSVRIKRVLSDPAYATAAIRRRLGSLPAAAPPDPDSMSHYHRLTEIYVRECSRAGTITDRYMEVRYEDVVQHPHACAIRLAAFVGLAPQDLKLERAAAFVERPRSRQRLLPRGPDAHKAPLAGHSRQAGMDAISCGGRP